jgi:hypothetical protein
LEADTVDKKLTTAEIVIVASGLVILVFSFFAYFGEGDFKINAWDEFPLFTYGAIFGAVAAAQVLATKLGGMQLPSQVLGFSWPQVHMVLGLFALLNTFGIFVAGEDAKIGLLLGLLGSIGLVIGAYMLQQENRSSGPSY